MCQVKVFQKILSGGAHALLKYEKIYNNIVKGNTVRCRQKRKHKAYIC